MALSFENGKTYINFTLILRKLTHSWKNQFFFFTIILIWKRIRNFDYTVPYLIRIQSGSGSEKMLLKTSVVDLRWFHCVYGPGSRHFRSMLSRIQWFDDKTFEILQLLKTLHFLIMCRIEIYLSLCLQKGWSTCRKSLQTLKENIQHLKTIPYFFIFLWVILA